MIVADFRYNNIQQAKKTVLLTRCTTYYSPRGMRYSGRINAPHGGQNRISKEATSIFPHARSLNSRIKFSYRIPRL